jgi:hypothetical protein
MGWDYETYLSQQQKFVSMLMDLMRAETARDKDGIAAGAEFRLCPIFTALMSEFHAALCRSLSFSHRSTSRAGIGFAIK